MPILYYDCFAGISGDMNLGALLDLGVDQDFLLNELQKLNLGSYDVKIQRDQRRGITGTRVNVLLPGHSHQERTFRDIANIIEDSSLSPSVKAVSIAIFKKLAEAEGKIHNRAVDDVHFHEIGAVDSIVDIVGAAVCLDFLQAEQVISSPIQVGGGFVKCEHGLLPVPAPATLELLRGIPMKAGLVEFEATTPTGAAILAATAHNFTETLDFTPLKIGYGIGHRDSNIPNVLRVCLGDIPEQACKGSDIERGEAVIMECNIDDMNPEHYPFVMDLLFEQGAQDVFFTPIIMKKSRPAVKISVLCDIRRQKALEEILWLHSSTFGLRSYKVAKAMLHRETVSLETEHGTVSVKNGFLNGRRIKSKPEYDECLKLAREKGLALTDIIRSISDAGREK